MNIRLILTLPALGAVLGVLMAGCADMPKKLAAALAPEAVITSPNGPVGHTLDEVMTYNGPPSRQWDMPDGRTAYEWQSAAISATIAPASRGEIKSSGVSQVMCSYTLYSRPDAKGVAKIVAAEDTKPGCMRLAMVGQNR